MFRYTKDIIILNSDRSNWLVITKSIWGSLDKEIRIMLYTPLRYKSLDKFILRIKKPKLLSSISRKINRKQPRKRSYLVATEHFIYSNVWRTIAIVTNISPNPKIPIFLNLILSSLETHIPNTAKT
jgi:hypothetical protein